jgi:branched-chain amino acid transport system permease protein
MTQQAGTSAKHDGTQQGGSGRGTGIRRTRRGRGPFALTVLVILLLLPLLQVAYGTFNYVLHLTMYTLLYVAMASSWNIIGGYAGYTSLGHNVFYAVGAYFSGTLFAYLGISPLLTFPIAGILATLIGLLVGLISMRTRGPTFIIASIAMVMLVLQLLRQWDFVGGTNGISLPFIPLDPSVAKLPFYYIIVALAAGSVILSYRIRHSKFGLGLRAISQDETKAETAGIATNKYKIAAFAISGFFVGMSGAVWGYYLTYLRPSIFLAITIASYMVLMSILGGRGTVLGPVIGAIIIIQVNEFFVSNFGGTALNIVFTGIVLILTLLFFPKGVVGSLKERGKLPAFLDWE